MSMNKGYSYIDIDKLVKAEWNYKEEDHKKSIKLKANISRNGQVENIIVRELSNDVFEVVNGNHRYDAFKELGYKEVFCYNLGKITDREAKRLAIETNEISFDKDEILMAETVHDILKDFDINSFFMTTDFEVNEIEAMNLLGDQDYRIFQMGIDSKWDKKEEEAEIPDFDPKHENVSKEEKKKLVIYLEHKLLTRWNRYKKQVGIKDNDEMLIYLMYNSKKFTKSLNQ